MFGEKNTSWKILFGMEIKTWLKVIKAGDAFSFGDYYYYYYFF